MDQFLHSGRTGKMKKKFKDCNWKHQKNRDISLEPKIPLTFEVCFEFIKSPTSRP
jgi:hypothetical protein